MSERICENCGNDLAAEDQPWCVDCLAAHPNVVSRADIPVVPHPALNTVENSSVRGGETGPKSDRTNQIQVLTLAGRSPVTRTHDGSLS